MHGKQEAVSKIFYTLQTANYDFMLIICMKPTTECKSTVLGYSQMLPHDMYHKPVYPNQLEECTINSVSDPENKWINIDLVNDVMLLLPSKHDVMLIICMKPTKVQKYTIGRLFTDVAT